MRDDQENKLTHTRIIFSSEARKQMYEGIRLAAEAVSCTLGPRGKLVLIQGEPGKAPIVTKDGVSVSRAIKLRDPLQRMGAELIREAASKTNDIAGDGTTTATVLTHSMVKEGLKLVEAGFSPVKLCKGIELACKSVVDALKKEARQVTTVEEITQVGTISANGDAKIGQLIAQAMEKVGRDGIITIEDAKGMQTTLELAEGMQVERGYLSPYFVTNADKMHASYQDALVLVTDKKLSTLAELVPILERCFKSQHKLLIIADDVEGEALQGLVLNRVKQNFPVVAIKAPGYSKHRDELLRDICVLTGANLVSSSTGISLDKLQLNDLGRCKKIVVDAKSTTLVGSGQTKDAVDKHVADLKSQLEDVTLDMDGIIKLKARVAKLSSGVAVIKVGGATELEMVEKKYRVEDALNATRAATEEGIVRGGGAALFNAALNCMSDVKKLSVDADTEKGMGIVFTACFAPVRRIAENANVSADVVVADLTSQKYRSDIQHAGYNAAVGKIENMFLVGVIDPMKVSRTALQNAASVATTFLSLDAVICEEAVED